jgi:hypothetical protein
MWPRPPPVWRGPGGSGSSLPSERSPSQGDAPNAMVALRRVPRCHGKMVQNRRAIGALPGACLKDGLHPLRMHHIGLYELLEEQ